MAEKSAASAQYIESSADAGNIIPDIGSKAAAEDVVNIAQESENTRYNPISKHMLSLYLVLTVPYLCGCLNGYDGSLMGGLNGMKSYQDYFHMYVPTLKDFKEQNSDPQSQVNCRLIDWHYLRHLQHRFYPCCFLHWPGQ